MQRPTQFWCIIRHIQKYRAWISREAGSSDDIKWSNVVNDDGKKLKDVDGDQLSITIILSM